MSYQIVRSAEAWKAQAQQALDDLAEAGASATMSLSEMHAVDADAFGRLIEALVALEPVTGQRVEPAMVQLAGLRPVGEVLG